MSFLLQKDVPLIVTILVGAWTWLVSENIRQTNDLQIVEYQYNFENAQNKILFHNISQSKSIEELRIAVSCASGKSCFELKGDYAGTTTFVPPFGVVPTEPGVGERMGDTPETKRAYFTFSLPVDAAIVLILNSKSPEVLRFTVFNSEQFEKLKVLDANSCLAFLYRNYWLCLIVLLVAASVGVAGLVLLANSPAKKQDPSKHDVRLTIGRDK